MENVKNDTGYYPVFLTDLTLPVGDTMLYSTIRKGWNGPYTKQIPIDPWGKAYI